jgi:hypothetical protein
MLDLKRSSVLHLVLAVVVLLSGLLPAWACPFCSAPSLTLSEQMEQADVVLQVAWKESRKGSEGEAGVTVYEITKIVKAPEGLLKVGDNIELPAFRASTKGKKYLLTGTQTAAIEWGTPLDVTEEAFEYIVKAPAPSLGYEKRLPYFIKHLEHEDDVVATDAYAEFANAPYEEIAKVGEHVPREKVRKWIADKETVPTRLGLYGLMLGLSGNEEDAALMLKKINEPTKDFRLGIDGIMSGYLMISGSEGLKILEIFKLKDKDVPFSETYAAMQALRFMWKYEPDTIAKDRLRQSMRILLDRPELADLVIADLARWEDWEVVDQLLVMYDDEDFSIPSIKRAIIRFLRECSKQSEKVAGDPPAYAVKATAALERIQKEDPKLYRNALRFERLR